MGRGQPTLRVKVPQVRPRRPKTETPEQRAARIARGIKNLKPGQRTRDVARNAHANDGNVPGLVELKQKTVYRQLVQFCRDNTPEAMQHVMEIMRGPYNPNVRLAAAEIIVQRGWGRAPIFVKISGDDDATGREAPKLTEMPREQFSREVLRILQEAGEINIDDLGEPEKKSTSGEAIETTATRVDNDGA